MKETYRGTFTLEPREGGWWCEELSISASTRELLQKKIDKKLRNSF